MSMLLDARQRRRRRELQELGGIVAYAFNDPQNLEKALPKVAGPTGDDVGVAPEQLERWW